MDRKSFLRGFGIVLGSTALTSKPLLSEPVIEVKEKIITKFCPDKFIGPYNKRFNCDVYRVVELFNPSVTVSKNLNIGDEVYVHSYNAELNLLAVVEPRILDGACINCKAELVRVKEDFKTYILSIDPKYFSKVDQENYEFYLKKYTSNDHILL